jgi:hypothetical protein
MSQRDEYQQLQKDHAALASDHLRLTEDYHELRNAYIREVDRLLQRNQAQEAMIRTADTMYRKLEGALGKVTTLLERHLEAGERHVPARALWHVLHETGFTVAPKPAMDHALHVALKNAPELERKNQQAQSQKPQEQPEQKQEQAHKQIQRRGMNR